MNNRGQVTLFIIVGIILLFVIGLFLFVLRPEELKRNSVLVDDVSSEYSPVQNYVHSCIRQIGQEAIEILGERGGYIVNSEYRFDPRNVGLDPGFEDAYERDSLYLHPSRKVPVPYWWYMEGVDGSFSSKKLALRSGEDSGASRLSTEMSFEAQIDRYVNEKLLFCLDDFSIFAQRSTDVFAKETVPVSTTYIRDKDVVINVYYPLEVSLGDKTEELKNFGITLPVRLEDTYLLAEMIYQSETKYKFLEHFLQTILVLNGNINNPLLPPMHDFTFEFGNSGNQWDIPEVKENVKQLLSYTNLLQVQGSKNFDRIFVDTSKSFPATRQAMYDNTILPINDYYDAELISELNLENTKVNFNYFNFYDIYFNINGDESGTFEPKLQGIDFSIIKFGFQQYRAFFDVSWPVIVTLNDESAFNGDGFVFNFALEGNLRDNEPINTSYVAPITAINNGPKFCDSKDKNVTIQIFSDDCDENLENCLPVSNAGIVLMFGDQSCSLGQTTSNGTLITQVPTGILSGWIKAVKDGYLDELVQFTPLADGYIINGMRTKKEFNFIIRKIIANKNGTLENGIYNLEENEEVLVTLKRINSEGDDGELLITLFFNSSDIMVSDSITDGLYLIDAKLFGEPNPELSINYLNSLENITSLSQEQLDSSKEIILGNLAQNPTGGLAKSIKGGVSFGYIDEQDAGNPIRFYRSQIKNGNEIILYVLELKDLNNTNVDDLNILNDMFDLTRQYQDYLIPEIKWN